MKKIVFVILIAVAAIVPFLIFKNITCPLSRPKENLTSSIKLKTYQENLLKYLKLRKDNLATKEVDKILKMQPDDLCALWGKAEIFRRAYKFEDAERLLNQVLAKYPEHTSSLVSLSYIRYHDNEFAEALELLKEVLRQPDLDRKDKAMAYMLIGSINAKKAAQGGLLSKVVYGTRILGYFERALVFAPDLPEVHLGLGTYCLLAPKIAGGNLDRAIEELEWVVRLAPDFATANARLAQAYKKKGALDKYNFYLQRAKRLDPENEVVKEIEISL